MDLQIAKLTLFMVRENFNKTVTFYNLDVRPHIYHASNSRQSDYKELGDAFVLAAPREVFQEKIELQQGLASVQAEVEGQRDSRDCGIHCVVHGHCFTSGFLEPVLYAVTSASVWMIHYTAILFMPQLLERELLFKTRKTVHDLLVKHCPTKVPAADQDRITGVAYCFQRLQCVSCQTEESLTLMGIPKRQV